MVREFRQLAFVLNPGDLLVAFPQPVILAGSGSQKIARNTAVPLIAHADPGILTEDDTAIACHMA